MRFGSTVRKQQVRSRWVFALALTLTAFLSGAGTAHAEPDFPTKIEKLATLPCTPACLLCHTDPAGGLTHMRNAPDGAPWGLLFSFLKAGGTAEQLAPFDTKDSDADGVSDLKELQAGQDPLVKGDSPICSDLKYGCGASHLARRAPLDRGSAAWLATAAVGVALLVRRRAQSRR